VLFLVLPALVCFVVAVVLARLLGPAMRAAERLTRHSAFGLRLAVLALARAPSRTVVSCAFVAVALGLALFAATYRATLARGAVAVRDRAASGAGGRAAARRRPGAAPGDAPEAARPHQWRRSRPLARGSRRARPRARAPARARPPWRERRHRRPAHRRTRRRRRPRDHAPGRRAVLPRARRGRGQRGEGAVGRRRARAADSGRTAAPDA